MKNQLPHLATLILLLLFSTCSCAQKNKDDAKITIKIDGVEQDIETYFEEWGERLEHSIENAIDGDTRISIEFDDDDLDLVLNDFSVAVGELVESVSKAVAHAVTHMDIELSDMDRQEIKESNVRFHDTEIDDLIEEIEGRYNSRVEKIEKMKLKVREDYIKIDMHVRLENGRRINKVKVIPHN